jgi:hypothetical protein
MSAAENFANASKNFSDASATIGTYSGDVNNKKTVLAKLAGEITEGINAMKAGLDASAATAPEPAAAPETQGGSKNKKNNKDKDNKDKKSKNNR